MYKKLIGESEIDYKVRVCKERNSAKGTKKDIKWDDFADIISEELSKSYSGEQIRQFWKSYRKRHGLGKNQTSTTARNAQVKIDESGSQTSNMDGIEVDSIEDLKDETFLLKLHKYNPEEWSVDSASSSQWEAQTPNGIKTLYSTKIKVSKKRGEYYNYEKVNKFFKEYKPKKYNENLQVLKEKKYFLLEPADMHLGKTENATLEEQVEKACSAIKEIIHAAKKTYDIGKVLLTMGNDWLNADTVIPQSNVQRTNKGTILSGRNSYDEIFEAGLKVGLFVIDEILKINEECSVEVIYIPANHDRTSSYGLCHALNQRFYNNDRVNFDLDFKNIRKYRLFGNMGIGFCHGDKPRNQVELGKLFMFEAPQIFANVKYREIHAAHYHSEGTKDDKGVLTRRLSSVSPKDTWLEENGYVGAQAKVQSFIIGENFGIEAIFNGYVTYD